MAMTRKRLVRIGFYSSTAVVLFLFLLNPYTRQSVFGPKIRGEPLCYWQHEFRRRFARSDYQTPPFIKVIALLGIKSPSTDPQLPGGGSDLLTLALSLIDDPNPNVRAAVAFNLREFSSSPEAEDALLSLLDDPDAWVRARAAETFRHTHAAKIRPVGEAALPRLIEMLEDPSMLCRVRAAGAIWSITREKPARSISVLRDALRDSTTEPRLAAVEELALIGEDAAYVIRDVVACADDEPNVNFRAGIIRQLGSFGPASVPFLRRALHDPAPDVRSRAIYALHFMESRAMDAVPDLAGLLHDPDTQVRQAAAHALSRIDPEQYPEKRADP
jgi:HEAT repeat protein